MVTLEIEKGNYISRIWFTAGCGMDIFACLSRRLPDGQWRFAYRFRYYEDSQAHDSEDRKSVYEAWLPETYTEDQVVERLDSALAVVALAIPEARLDVTLIQTDEPEAVACLMRGKPYWHVQLREVPS